MAATIDVLLIFLSIFLAEWIYGHFVPFGIEEMPREIGAAIFVAMIFNGMMRFRTLYDPVRLIAFRDQISSILSLWLGAFLVLFSGIFASGVGGDVSRGDIFLFCAFGLSFILGHHSFWRFYLPYALRTGALRGPTAALISWNMPSTPAIRKLLARHGYDIAANFDMTAIGDESGASLLDFIESIQGSAIDEIFLFARADQASEIQSTIGQLRVLPLPVTLIPHGALNDLFSRSRYELGHKIAIEVQRAPLSFLDQVMKRVLDLIVSSCGVVMLAPVLAMIAIAIKMESPGPVFFRQTRRGFNGRPFEIFKFRSMKVQRNDAVVAQATRDDPRVTRIGYWLRRLSLDELPQIFNVFLGQMSIVGPRPHAVAHDVFYSSVVEHYFFRHHVKAGITGWAQVNGARGETDTVDKMERRVELDIWYINNWSVLLDLMIIVRTVTVVFGSRNVY